jgi:imidazolonepropionase-like amidohydrolase
MSFATRVITVFMLMSAAAFALDHQVPVPGSAMTPALVPVAFTNVDVVPMDSDRVLPGQTVIIRDGRIAAMGPASAITPPSGATLVDGRGKFLMPGLTEMHGHVPAPAQSPQFAEQVMFLYVAGGVTTVRGMQGAPGQFELRDRALRQEIVGPMLYLAGPQFSGQTARSPEEAAERVRSQKQEGWDLLKVQLGLSIETYEAMAKTAREVGIDFGGHVPAAVGLDRALAAGQKTIDHMDFYAESVGGDKQRLTDEAIARLVEKVKASGTWTVPTMYVWETLRGPVALESRTSLPELKYLPRAQVTQWTTALTNRLKNPNFNAQTAGVYIENRMRILTALHKAGARLLLGSDAPQQFNVPGFSLHLEMQRMREAGMTPYEILKTGTADVGDHFSARDRFGRVAVGQRADLILANANPLGDLGSLRSPAGVMVRGRWLPAADIQKQLDAIAAINAQ